MAPYVDPSFEWADGRYKGNLTLFMNSQKTHMEILLWATITEVPLGIEWQISRCANASTHYPLVLYTL